MAHNIWTAWNINGHCLWYVQEQALNLAIVTARPGYLRLYNRIYRQDVWRTTWLHHAEEDGCTKS